MCFQATCQQHQQPYHHLPSHLLRSPANCMSSRINRKCNKQSQEKKIYPTNAWERQKIVCSFGTLRFAQLFWAFAVATELTGEGNTHYSDNIFPYADIYFRTCVLVFVFALCVCVCVLRQILLHLFCSFSHVSQFVPSAVLNYIFMFALCDVKSQRNCEKPT